MELPPLHLGDRPRKVVGFDTSGATTSPSSVLHSPASNDADYRRSEGPDNPTSPLTSALRRDLSMPSLQVPALPKLKLGLGRGKMPRSKSHGNLLASQPAAVPRGQRSATSSPHAASSGGSEPVTIPFEISRRRRTHSVDFSQQPGPADGGDDDVASTPVISAASSLLSHHLAGAAAAAAPGAAAAQDGSVAGSPLSGGGPQLACSQSVAKDLFAAQADAVMAHAQVQNLQSALKKEQDEVSRLREQLQLMTAERDRLLMELQQGGAAPLFDMDTNQVLPSLELNLMPPLPHRAHAFASTPQLHQPTEAPGPAVLHIAAGPRSNLRLR